MRIVKSVCFAALWTVGVALTSTAASAASLTCPTGFSGDNTTTYTLESATSCAYGTGTLNNNDADGALVTGYVNPGTYPSPPSPDTNVYPIPEDANFLEKTNTPGTGTYLTIVGDNTGTITFDASYNYTNVLVAVVDGQSTTPNWAVFTLDDVSGGTVLDFDVVRLDCNTKNGVETCKEVAQGTSHVILYAQTVAVPGPIVGAGLPGLMAACGGLLVLARRRRQKLA